jgi:shikimate dehydrogenase
VPSRRALLSAPTAATRVAGVIGDPVGHSLSPVLHNAAFAEMGVDWVYVAFHVPAGQAAGAVEAMRTMDIAGLSVTMPHKADVAAAVDSLGPVAGRLGVANTVSWSRATSDAFLVGESTDGAGFIDALGDDGFDPSGRRCLVLGAGGAARAVTLALAEAGAAAVAVAGRRAAPTAECALLAGEGGRAVDAGERTALQEAASDADLIVNATPVGMGGETELPFALEPDSLRSGHFVADLIYTPATTPLLSAARRAGATATNGLGMLIHQAGRQVELWTGRPAPVEAMSAAVVGALTHRSG